MSVLDDAVVSFHKVDVGIAFFDYCIGIVAVENEIGEHLQLYHIEMFPKKQAIIQK